MEPRFPPRPSVGPHRNPTPTTSSLNPVTDLNGYEIYVNESGSFADADAPNAVVSAVDPATHTLTSSFNLANLAPYLSKGVVYKVSMRAVAITGLKSDFSPPLPSPSDCPFPIPHVESNRYRGRCFG